MKRISFLAALAVPFFLVSCGGGEQKTESQSTVAATEQSSESDAPVSNVVEITSNDQMKFDLEEIRVKAGQEVTLTLKNEGKMAKEAMGHNFVLLQPGTDVAAFAQEAMNNKPLDYIPADTKAIVAFTELLGPGESDTITFTLEKGTYDFICSFPGHYGTMKGKVIAE